jgi:hypothetical protein
MPDTYPLRFKLAVDVLSKSGNGQVIYESCEPSQLRLKIRSSTARVSGSNRLGKGFQLERSTSIVGGSRVHSQDINDPNSWKVCIALLQCHILPAFSCLFCHHLFGPLLYNWRRFPPPFLCPHGFASLCLPLTQQSAFMWPRFLQSRHLRSLFLCSGVDESSVLCGLGPSWVLGEFFILACH